MAVGAGSVDTPGISPGYCEATTLLASPSGACVPLGLADPAGKLLAALLFAVGTSVVRHPAVAAVALFFPLFLAVLGRISWKSLFRRLVPVNFFFLFLWVTLPVSFSPYPDTLATLGPFYFRGEGLWTALAITLKGNAIAASLLILPGTSAITENARALLLLHVPEKLVTLLLLTQANILLMQREAGRLFVAARLRGFSPAGGKGAYSTYAWLFGLLFVRAFSRAERVSEAMRLRGFQGRFPLICPKYTNFGRRLGVLLATAAGVYALLLQLAEQYGPELL